MLRPPILGSLLLLASAAGADDLKHGNFSLSAERLLQLRLGGRPLVVKDSLDYTAGFQKAEQPVIVRQRDKQVLNVVHSQADPVSYRKEAALGSEGVELTVKYKLPAYRNDLEKPSIHYAFSVPFEALRDTRWKAVVGRAHSAKVVEGKVGSSLSGIRYIAFHGQQVRLVFDFNPLGVCADGDYCAYGEPVACWSMEREGEFLLFRFGYRASFFGGTFMSKCLIYEGEYDYAARHAWSKWGYRGETLPTKLYAFGTARPPKEAAAADLAIYAPANGYGWRQGEGLTLSQTSPTGLINNCLRAAPGREGRFLVDLVPGRWLLSVRIAPGPQAVGPMEILLSDRPAVAPLTVAAGDARSVTLPVDHRGPGPLEIGFRGPEGWAVSSIALQPVLYRSEDFSLDRGLWNVDGVFTPD